MDEQKIIEIQIPSDTYLQAHQKFPRSNPYLLIGQNLNMLVNELNFKILDPSYESNIRTILRLSLLTVFQHLEILSDSQVSDAILKRIDWKYALFLPLNFPGFAKHKFSDFRQKLIGSRAALDEFGKLLKMLSEFGYFEKKKTY